MKFWITKNSEVTVRDQIVLQVHAGIASGDLQPCQKLPSTRELSRRFGIHANTVSAAYRKLILDGTVVMRKGSGIFIRDNRSDALDTLISSFLRDATKAGFTQAEVLGRILGEGGTGPINGFSLFEPDDDLAEILIYEIKEGTGLPVERVYDPANSRSDFRLIALFDEQLRISEAGRERDCLFLKANSIAKSLIGRMRPNKDEMVAVVSGWSDFLVFARLFLLAAGIDPSCVLTVSTRGTAWKRSLKSASVNICDVVTSAQLPRTNRLIVFPVVSSTSIEELNRLSSDNVVAPA